MAELNTYQDKIEEKERYPSLNLFGIEQGLGIMCGESPSIESFILNDIPNNAILVRLENDYIKQEDAKHHLSLVDHILLEGENVVLIEGKHFVQMKPSVYSLKFRLSESLPESLKNLDFSHPLEIELTSF